MYLWSYNIKYIKNFILIVLCFLIINVISGLNAVEYTRYNKVRLQILNKITGKNNIFDVTVNTIFHFDNKLSLIVKACYKATQKYAPEDVMFIQVAKSGSEAEVSQGIENNINILNNANEYVNKKQAIINPDIKDELPNISVDSISSRLIFSGWIFLNLPEISSLTDNVYDINIIKCLN